MEIATDPEVCEYDPVNYSGSWCTSASDAIAEWLNAQNIKADVYAASWTPDEPFVPWGGVKIDDSHTWIVLEDGTILDPTIRQFIDSPNANAEQQKTARGYPYVNGFPDVAVVPVGHPFIKKMGYESHTTGGGWAEVPSWWRSKRLPVNVGL
jgi:hypothetical protein